MRARVLLAPILVASALVHALQACDAGTPASPRLGTPPSATGSPAATAEGGAADAEGGPVTAGARRLGLATDRTRASFPEDLRAARDAGARLTTVTTAWDAVEQPFDARDGDASATALYEPTLHIAGLVAPAVGTRAVLELDVLDDGVRRAPADLATTPLGDPTFLARWVKAQEYVLAQTRDLDVAAYVIGARVDRALGPAPAAYAEFATFFAEAARAARAVRPGLVVGFAVSPSAFAAHAADLAPAWAASDLVAVRLDPVRPDADGGLPSPEAAAAAIERAAAAAPPGKPLHVLGAAYPAGQDAGGSPGSQSAFVHAAFAAWDCGAARAPVLVFEPLEPPAFEAFREEARVRGF